MPCDDCSRTESCPPCPNEEEPKGSEPPSTECKKHCMTHPYGAPHVDGKCCSCGITREELAESEAPTKGDFLRCWCTHFQMNHRSFIEGGCRNCACDTFKLKSEQPEEPPLTPEEEEEAPCPHESWDVTGEHRDLLTRKWWKSRRCNDCGEGLHNVLEDEPHWVLEPAEPPPPQPGRRPPYAVSYSVQGHLYEVALPGDASVRAVDGALVIQHHLGPVAAICQVLPVINEESDGSA